MRKILVINNQKYAESLFYKEVDINSPDCITCDAKKDKINEWINKIETPPLYNKIRFGFIYNIDKNQINSKLLNLLEFSNAFIIASSSILLTDAIHSRLEVYDFSSDAINHWEKIFQYTIKKGFKNYGHGFWHEIDQLLELYKYSLNGIYINLEKIDLNIVKNCN